ncbi:transcriptional regulator [Gammaproteobacteria bacterium ESL0073]|nr:transcriptional regulator [Gammaproteobacteria bacterium ESL0073]
MQSNNTRLIRLKEVIQLTGLSRTTIYHYINIGTFPKHTKFGKSSLWDYSEVQQWINEQLAKHSHAPAIA